MFIDNKYARLFSPIIITIATIFITLFVAIQYKRLAYYSETVKLLSFDKLVQLEQMPPNARLHFKPKPNELLDSFSLEVKNYTMSTDTSGFVVTQTSSAGHTTRFVFAGGSGMHCKYIEEGKRLSDLVTKQIARQSKLNVHGINIATPNSHAFDILNHLNTTLQYQKTDYLFLYPDANDLHLLCKYGRYNSPSFEANIFFGIPQIKEIHKSDLQKINETSQYPLKSLEYNHQNKPLFKPKLSDSTSIINAITPIFNTLLANCKTHNIRTVIILPKLNFDNLSYEWFIKNMPHLKWTINEYSDYQELWHVYHNILFHIAKMNNVSTIDLNESLLNLSDFYDPYHLNSQGAEKAAEAIATECIFLDYKQTEN
jgi:hypothetical protein